MRERILGDQIIELLKKAEEPLTAWQISKRLGTGRSNINKAVTNLTYSELLPENDKGGIHLMEREK